MAHRDELCPWCASEEARMMPLVPAVRKALYSLPLHSASKAVRRDAKQLLALGGRPRGEPGPLFFMYPGSKTLRRDAKRLTDRSVIRGSFRAVEVWCVSVLMRTTRLLRPFFYGHRRGEHEGESRAQGQSDVFNA